MTIRLLLFFQGIDTAIEVAESAEELETMLSDVKAKADAAAAAGSEAGRAESNNPGQAWALAAHVETQKRAAERELQAKAGEKEATLERKRKLGAGAGYHRIIG